MLSRELALRLQALVLLLFSAGDAKSYGPGRFANIVLPRTHVDEENASFYVFRDDIVMFPMSYSIPKDRIVSQVPPKTAFAMNDSTRSFQFKNYKFGPLEEEEYHQHIQKHRFGDTRRKGGFDCLRHYELLANGCVPIFRELEILPKSLLTTLPKDLLLEAKQMFALPWQGTKEGAGEGLAAGEGAYDALATKLLQHTAKHLSTESAAQHVLRSLDVPKENSKVLYLPCSAFDNFPSYLTASVFHGLVSLLGDRVIDVPEYHYAYELDSGGDVDEEVRIRSNIWGQGFTLGFKLPRRPHLNRENISERIKNREFDLIIFARMSPYEPCNFYADFGGRGAAVPQFFEDVMKVYPRERVALLYGDDSGLDDAVIRTQLYRMGSLNRGLGMVFMREMLPFVSEGGPGETLRPVDGRLLQPGCFYREWIDFFSQWRTSGCTASKTCLLACAAWGHCDSEGVGRYLDSEFYELQRPPEDPSVLKQFCITGFALKAALLVQHLGPNGCVDDAICLAICDFSLNLYAHHLQRVPADLFFEEFGLTPQQVLYALSHGCAGSGLALQPALAERSQDVVFVADGAPLASGGALAGEWEGRYLSAQGYTLHVVGVDLSKDQVPIRLLPALDRGRLQLRSVTMDAAEKFPCSWLKTGSNPAPFLLHFDLSREGSAASAVRCLLQDGAGRPRFVALQTPSAPNPSMTAFVWQAVAMLLAAGYNDFKVSNLADDGLGGPLGDMAVDTVAGPQWRSKEEVLSAGALLPGAQIHATL